MKNLKKTLVLFFVTAALAGTIFANNGNCPPTIEAGGYICFLVGDPSLPYCAYECR